MTLIEVLFAMIVLAVASLALMYGLAVSGEMSDYNRQQDVAVSAAQATLEAIRGVPGGDSATNPGETLTFDDIVTLYSDATQGPGPTLPIGYGMTDAVELYAPGANQWSGIAQHEDFIWPDGQPQANRIEVSVTPDATSGALVVEVVVRWLDRTGESNEYVTSTLLTR
jgi:type II secretory pathway pseudopilin PulG